MNRLSKAGFGLALVAMMYLIWLLLVAKAPVNLATWVLWFILDLALLLSLIKAKQPYEIMVAYTIGTAIISGIAMYNFITGLTPFAWGGAETVTIVAVVVALIVWKFTSHNVGVIMMTLAMIVAGIPTWINAYHDPAGQSVLFWSASATACTLTYFGSPKGRRFMPGGGALSNALIVLLALRQFA